MTRSAADVRREFLEFFAQRGHTICPPSPVVPHDDPTLLFTNAGMNQFKPIFLGQAGAGGPFAGLKRAVNSQPCIRAGGKHNDLDDVGHDTYHHTFFEMLGNWSFGDYFKRDAIAWAWELLTKVWGVDKTRLHATYFGGDAAEGLEPDLEARDLWKEVAGLPDAHVHPGNKKDNFWEMGDTGPCGPCSEVHIDLTPDKSGAKLVNAGDARVMEIWNLVFIQFNRGADGKLTPLPAKHVDTGMGFERITAVLQGKRSNYDTDVFTPIFAAIQNVTNAPAYGGRLEGEDPDRAAVMRDIAYRVIADHIRTLTFAITDGAVPDKEGRGYVLRRILRRAVRYGWQYLNAREAFLNKLVPAVVEAMETAFPALKKNAQRVVEIIREEEQSFARTLDRGIALFEEAAELARKDHHGEMRGEDAFKLHDTYGFPIDLTGIMARERGMTVDIGEYERLMEAARERARSTSKAEGHALFDQWRPQAIPIADDSQKYALQLRCDATIKMLHVFDERSGAVAAGTVITESGSVQVSTHKIARRGDAIAMVTDQTCFYTESGGQVSDTGTARTESGEISITSLRSGGIHFGHVTSGEIRVEQRCVLTVNAAARRPTMKNHTATHLLNWALRETLGEHVQQKGSLVDPDKTRFDFSHPKPLAEDEIEKIEKLCNEHIERNYAVYAREAPQQDALKINGLRAVFGEKYPDSVRVVSIGAPVEDLLKNPSDARWRQFSVEFCGGTHVQRTGDIERFALTHEEAVAKGVRRVVGVSGETANRAEELGAALLQQAAYLKTASPEHLAEGMAALNKALGEAILPMRRRLQLRDALAELQERSKELHKKQAAAGVETLNARVDELLPSASKIGATTVFVAELPDAPAEQLKQAVDRIKQIHGSAAVLIGVRTAGDEKSPPKAVLLAAVTDDLVKKGVKAGDWIKAVAPLVEGGGGGPPTMAQAGGKNPAKLADALEAGRAWILGKNL